MKKTFSEWRIERDLSLEYIAKHSMVTLKQLEILEVLPKHILLMNWLEVKSLCAVLDITADELKY